MFIATGRNEYLFGSRKWRCDFREAMVFLVIAAGALEARLETHSLSH